MKTNTIQQSDARLELVAVLGFFLILFFFTIFSGITTRANAAETNKPLNNTNQYVQQ